MSPPKPGAVLFAKSLERLAMFYERTLGMPVARATHGHVVLETETFEFVIHAIPEPIAVAIQISDPPEVREEAPIKLLFPVASIDDARAIAATLGGSVAPREREWVSAGRRVCDGHDPEGNVFQLRQAAP